MKHIFYHLLDTIRGLIITIFSSRHLVVALIFCIMFAVLFGRLFYLQIIRSDYYAENFEQKTEKTITHEGARGTIYDCNGKTVAHNEIGYSVYMTDLIPSSDEKGEILNGIIYETIKVIEKYGDKITDDFNIEVGSDGKYQFKSNPTTQKITFLCNVFGVKSAQLYEKGYNLYTADEVMEYMCGENRFDIPEKYTAEETVKICTVRYALSLNAYQKYVETEIATDVSEKTRAEIAERRSELKGVEINEYYKRVYDEGVYMAAILGYTGEISEDELKEYNAQNDTNISYELGDTVGKSGIEKSMDAYLQGEKGTDVVFVDAKGNIMETVSSTKAGSGNDLTLTIDLDLQKVAYELLEREIAGVVVSKLVNYDYVPEANENLVNIPIKDVYYKLLTNVVSIDKFDEPTASSREKATLSAYNSRIKTVLQKIETELESPNASAASELDDEYNEYMYFIYDYLKDENILDSSLMDTTNKIYTDWENESSSLREFILGAISENWINSAQLGGDSFKYADSSQIYDTIVQLVLDGLKDNQKFAKKVYYYMIYDETISGRDVCLMLYDQEKIDADEDMEYRLENGLIDPFTFVKQQITNLVITPAMVALDPCSGSLVVTDSTTGKVKALVTYPTYDNNKFSGKIDSEYWNQITNDDSTPLYNRATQTLTAPGSTFKGLTAITGLSEGVITPNTYVFDKGSFDMLTPAPHCWIYPGSHGDVDLRNALSVSCNYYFYWVGYQLGFENEQDESYSSALGLEKMESYAVKVGLATKSGVEIEETEPQFSTTDSVRTAIGQGTNGFATVQLARYANTIAQKGKNYQLSLCDKITDIDGNTVKVFDPVLTNTVELSADNWNAIHDGMVNVTTIGTAMDVFADSEYMIAGKTGTAQENVYRSAHATFIGFCPWDNPKLSFACIIRNGDSASYPAEICKDVVSFYNGDLTFDEILESKAKEITGAVVSD